MRYGWDFNLLASILALQTVWFWCNSPLSQAQRIKFSIWLWLPQWFPNLARMSCTSTSYDWKKLFNPVIRIFSFLFPVLHCALRTLSCKILRGSTLGIFRGPCFQLCNLPFTCNCTTFQLSCCISIFFAVSLMHFLFCCYFCGLTFAKDGVVIMVGSHRKWLSMDSSPCPSPFYSLFL